jgi:hypothetical protein
MALSDWDFITESTFTRNLYPDGIVDSSLFWSSTGTSSNTGSVMQINSTFERGHLKGVMRTLIRRIDVGTTSSTNVAVGMYSMTNQLTAPHFAGNMYVCRILADGTVDLAKGTGGADDNMTTVGTPTSATWLTFGDTIALEFEWDASDQGGLGGTRLIGRLGTALDFTGLVEFENIVDSTSPFTTSIAEGLFFRSHSGVSTNSFLFDKTRIQEIFF